MRLSFLCWIFWISISLPGFLDGYSHSVHSLLRGSLENGNPVFNKRDVINDEFKTLEDDIIAVKKLKLMVEMFRRIKRNNPIAYERMVNFFEKNGKAHRLRRSFLQELKSIGKKKKLVAALENKLDSTARCHPKSGKELIQMFVKGLSELYPDMTKLLLSELQGALDDGSEQPKKGTTAKKVASPTKPANTTAKAKEEKNPSKEEKKKDEKKVESKDVQCTNKTTTPACCHTTTKPTTACTSCRPCKITIACEQDCLHRFAENPNKSHEFEDDDTGDIRSRSGSTNGPKDSSRTPTKRRAGKTGEDPKLKAGPFKDFQVQGSISFSNPSKKLASAHLHGSNAHLHDKEVLRINRARMSSGDWKEWFPKEDIILHGLSVNPEDANKVPGQPKGDSGSQHLKSGFGEDKIKGCDSYIALLNRSLEKYSLNAATRATPDDKQSPLNKNAELSIFPDVGPRLKPYRNRKRSMYVLYEK